MTTQIPKIAKGKPKTKNQPMVWFVPSCSFLFLVRFLLPLSCSPAVSLSPPLSLSFLLLTKVKIGITLDRELALRRVELVLVCWDYFWFFGGVPSIGLGWQRWLGDKISSSAQCFIIILFLSRIFFFR